MTDNENGAVQATDEFFDQFEDNATAEVETEGTVTEATTGEATEAAEPKKAKRKIKPYKRQLNRDMLIVAKTTEPLLRPGTNRYRNQAVILGCTTVGEAMDKLKALDPSPGSGADILVAVKCDAIELLTTAQVA